MPGEQSAVEYYHYYLASQRRVERWVQRTDKELRELQAAGFAAQNSSAAVVVSDVERQEKGVRADKDAVAQQTTQQRHERRRRSERVSSSSKHRTSEGRSHSNSQPSSGSKKIKTTHTSPKSTSRNPRRESSRTTYSNGDITLTSYLPYGVLPLLYAITGSPALSIVAAILLLAIYLYMDYDGPTAKKRSSSSS